MPSPTELATLDQRVQVGIESTTGTPVAATKILTSWTQFNAQPNVDVDIDSTRGMGQKFPTLATVGKEFTQIAVGGHLTFDELLYPLSLAFKTDTVTAGGDASTKFHTYALTQTTQETYTSATFEYGDALRGRQYPGCVMPDFSFTLDLMANTAEWSGSVIGWPMVDNTALTAALPSLAVTAQAPANVDVFSDDTYAGMVGVSPTKLTRCLKAEWAMSGHWGQFWTLNSTLLRKPASVIETPPVVTLKLTLEADTAGMAMLTAMRAGASKYIGLKVTGPTAGSSTQNFVVWTPAKIISAGPLQDDSGIVAYEVTAGAIYDITGAANITLRLENLLTSAPA